MRKIDYAKGYLPFNFLLLAFFIVTMDACAQFGGFNPNMQGFGNMTPQVKHTKVDKLTSNLPIITITAETELNASKKVTAHMKTEGYDGIIGIKLRGNSSLSFNQKKYTFETRDANGKEQDVALLGMPAHSDWVLLAPYNDISMMRDPLAFQLWREMGQRSGHHRGLYSPYRHL